jgi:16S rRNA (guanine(966)-N(2))-methyltransferase RsmD
MRVIGGRVRGRRLRSLKGLAMRPTQDRVKEALFNILGGAVDGCRFLDLFAGAGGVGIEALSRGAERVVLVENHPPAVKVIRDNLAACGFRSGYRVFGADALRFIDGAERRSDRFDIVFLDPPYRSGLAGLASEKLGDSQIIAPHGRLVVEHPSSESPARRYGRLLLGDTRRFGDTTLSFYHPSPRNSADSPLSL